MSKEIDTTLVVLKIMKEKYKTGEDTGKLRNRVMNSLPEHINTISSHLFNAIGLGKGTTSTINQYTETWLRDKDCRPLKDGLLKNANPEEKQVIEDFFAEDAVGFLSSYNHQRGEDIIKQKVPPKSNSSPSTEEYSNMKKAEGKKMPPHSLNKRQVEKLAIEYVRSWLEKEDKVKVVEAKGEGCDLTTNDGRYIEVKGSSYSKPPIMVYESIFEYLKKEGISPNRYFIYIVSDIATEPKLRIITPEMQKWQEKKIRVLENQLVTSAKQHSLVEYRTQVENKLAIN